MIIIDFVVIYFFPNLWMELASQIIYGPLTSNGGIRSSVDTMPILLLGGAIV